MGYVLPMVVRINKAVDSQVSSAEVGHHPVCDETVGVASQQRQICVLKGGGGEVTSSNKKDTEYQFQ